MEEQWRFYKQAQKRQKEITEKLCDKYDCYEWEIATEQEKPKNKRKEILPYIKKHLLNGIDPSEEVFFDLMHKHKLRNEDEDSNLEIDLDWFDDKPVMFLEELLQHLISKLKTKSGQRI